MTQRSATRANWLALVGLSSLALMQPLLALLAEQTEFLVVHHTSPGDVVALVVGLAVSLPLVLIGLELAARWVGFGRVVHLGMLGLLSAAIALPPLARLEVLPGAAVLGGAMLSSGLGIAAYVRHEWVRHFAQLLAVSPLIFALAFALDESVRKLILAPQPVHSRAVEESLAHPVVVVVFDEFPVVSLLGDDGRIDAARYPNFARLASSSSFFTHAATVSDESLSAVSAILSGRYPQVGQAPTLADHPENLFTWLATGENSVVMEAVTSLYLSEPHGSQRPAFWPRFRLLVEDLAIVYLHVLLPDKLGVALPRVDSAWTGFADSSRTGSARRLSEEVINDFVSRFQVGLSNGLYFLHSMTPHVPHRSFPSGKRYTRHNLQPSGEGQQWGRWSDDTEAVMHAHQRHLLEVGNVDRLLGKLLDRLEELALYDDALIVVTADHGISFRPGQRRRKISQETASDILLVPLFIKLPDQRSPVVRDDPVETIDILPTIADALDVGLPWEIEGVSVFAAKRPVRSDVRCHTKRGPRFFSADLRRQRAAALAHKIRLFGTGSDPTRIFRLGPHADLVGRSVGEFEQANEPRGWALLSTPWRYRAVNPAEPEIPAEITGAISDARVEHLAIAVNGVIRGVTRPYLYGDEKLKADGAGRVWATLVPEDTFRTGANELAVYAIERGTESAVLTALPLCGRNVADSGCAAARIGN